MFKGGSGYRGSSPKVERRPGGPAGPYPSESSNPAIRRRARQERSKVAAAGGDPYLPTYLPPSGASRERAESFAKADRRAAERKRKRKVATSLRRGRARRVRRSEEERRQAKRAERRIERSRRERARERRRKAPPESKPKRYAGLKTAGEPTLRELRKADEVGQLESNSKGFLTTPKVRRVARVIGQIQSKRGGGSAVDLPYLEPHQAHNARTVLRRGEKARATRREKLAAIETGLVEAPDFENPAGGDADSEGWRQERRSLYPNPRNVRASADRFFKEVRTDAGTSTAPTPGLLAQAAQGSAFPERYDERAPEAKAILRAYNQGKLSPADRRRLSAAQREARELGLKVGDGRRAKVPKKVLTRFKAGLRAAKELEKAKLPYVWGGGHGDPESRPTGGGLDCSAAVSYVLNKMKVMKGSLVSGDMGSVLKPGPGAVTVFYNPTHTFMRIGKRYFGTSRTNPGGGPGFIDGTPDDLSKYSVGHVPGLGAKVATQLGVPLTEGGVPSLPGMSLSETGTTATIDSGAGVKRGKPGFSASPIRMTPQQRARRTLRRVREVDLTGEGTGESDVSPTLSDLERKYGVSTG
jgi:hypothetical protein